MKTLREKISELVPERRDNIDAAVIRLFGEEMARRKEPEEYKIIFTSGGKEESFGFTFLMGEILMADILGMPCFSVQRFNEKFEKRGIRIEKIENETFAA